MVRLSQSMGVEPSLHSSEEHGKLACVQTGSEYKQTHSDFQPGKQVMGEITSFQ